MKWKQSERIFNEVKTVMKWKQYESFHIYVTRYTQVGDMSD